MKALSIKQPWADWILGKNLPQGIQPKDIENRSRNTKFRGKFYIHASQKFSDDAFQWFRDTFGVEPVTDRTKYTTGAIIGTGYIWSSIYHESHFKSPMPWGMNGFYHWWIQSVEEIEPIPAKGFLGFWDCSDYLIKYKCEKCGNIITRKQFKMADFKCKGVRKVFNKLPEPKGGFKLFDTVAEEDIEICGASLKHYKRIEK